MMFQQQPKQYLNITEDVAQVEAPDMDVNIEEIIDPAGEGDSDPPEKDA